MRTQLKLAILPLFLFTLALNTGVFGQKSTTQELAASVSDWTKAYNEANADALGTHYTEDAVVTLSDGTTLTGSDAVKEFYAGGFKAMDAEASVQVSEVMDLSNGYALTTGAYTLKATMKASGEAVEVTGHFSTLSRKEDGQWKIVRELVSEKPAATDK